MVELQERMRPAIWMGDSADAARVWRAAVVVRREVEEDDNGAAFARERSAQDVEM